MAGGALNDEPDLQARQRGSAVVEFAICSTVLAPLALTATIFTELCLVKLKLQETTRYVAWEMTDFRLSDYQAGGQISHDAAFAGALATVAQEAKERYSDDFDGATRNPNIRSIPSLTARFLALDISQPDVAIEVQNQLTGALDFGGVTNPTGNHLSPESLLFERFGFNEKGLARISISGNVRAPFFNPVFRALARTPKEGVIGSGGLAFSGAAIEMLVDAWTLYDGSDVRLFPSTDTSAGTPEYGRQVRRMAFAGFETSLAGVDSAISAVRKILPIEDPLSPQRLTSITYSRKDGYSSGRVVLSVNQGVDSRHNRAQTSFHTAPIRDNWKYQESEPCLTLDQLDEGYMGCETGSESSPGAGDYPCLFRTEGICR